MKTITIPDCMHPAFELILNGIPYRYPAGQTVTVPDEIAALIAAHSEHHDAKYPGQEVQPPFRSDNIAEAPVLDAATEQTKVLAVEKDKVVQLPVSSLGGGGESGGATIYFATYPEYLNMAEISIGKEVYYETDSTDIAKPYEVGSYVFFISGWLGKVIAAEDNDDLKSHTLSVVWIEPNLSIKESMFNFDMCVNLDDFIQLLNGEGSYADEGYEKVEGDYVGQIMAINDDSGNSTDNSGAAMWLPSPRGYVWKRITA